MIQRSVLEALLADARGIAKRDKTEGLEGSYGYANALGRCNGDARKIVAVLEYHLEAK